MNRSINNNVRANYVRPRWTRRISRAVFMAFVTMSLALAVGCGDDEDDGDKNKGGDGGETTTGCNATSGQTCGMPPTATLSDYGLTGQPALTGATDLRYSVATVGGNSLSVRFTGSDANDEIVDAWLTDNCGFTAGAKNSQPSVNGTMVAYMYSKEGFRQASYTRDGTACLIQIVKS